MILTNCYQVLIGARVSDLPVRSEVLTACWFFIAWFPISNVYKFQRSV